MFRAALALALAALVALALFGCGGGSSQTATGTALTRAGKPAPQPAASKIAFNWNYTLYTVGEDGTGRAAVNTGRSGATGWPAWSRVPIDGKFMIATTSQHGLYVMNADGTGRRLLKDLGVDVPGYPCWSPDGTEILYIVPPDGRLNPIPSGYLHVVNVSTGVDTPVVNPTTDVPILGSAPAWSRAKPDRIVYTWGGTLPEQGPNGIFVISRSAPGQPWSAPVQIVPPAGVVRPPAAWSAVVEGQSWLMLKEDHWLHRAPVDAATGLPDTTQWQSVDGAKQSIGTFTISPDATRVCYRAYEPLGPDNNHLVVMDVQTGATSLLMPAERDPGGVTPDWSPNLN